MRVIPNELIPYKCKVRYSFRDVSLFVVWLVVVRAQLKRVGRRFVNERSGIIMSQCGRNDHGVKCDRGLSDRVLSDQS